MITQEPSWTEKGTELEAEKVEQDFMSRQKYNKQI
jgi:hypothetical protein